MTSSIPHFVSELYRSANEVAKLSTFERRRLVERAASVITEQRIQLAATGNVVSISSGVVAGIEAILPQIDDMPDPLASHILLECADEIRKLHILSAKTG
ncbi:hypothetical protein P6U16_25930 (plasmid) [Rhizobium sp. 32-5/1]|uniref:hypothetical protein n=1 Tax=Rhizobium sp. 32-5/1 TaxID=3019602 RepID=UPI00240D022A|nr:hypothetical protein [Rhizobium sp. 32-5/1]WEZ85510.1 hypothetical protein P6U16_25930 [Rhizobium sp. 32-5/1]